MNFVGDGLVWAVKSSVQPTTRVFRMVGVPSFGQKIQDQPGVLVDNVDALPTGQRESGAVTAGCTHVHPNAPLHRVTKPPKPLYPM